jgi:hypothetical protein
MSFVLLFVRYKPSDSMKTGTFGLDKSHILLSLFSALTGQYWLLGCRKRSTISPDGDLFFVILILKATCSWFMEISDHSRSSFRLQALTLEAISSPNLNNPKKATENKVHKTCLSLSDHVDVAI